MKARSVLVLLALCGAHCAWAQQDVITTAIGGGPNGIPGINSDIHTPNAITFDAAGNFYIAAYDSNRVFKVAKNGTLTLVAGNGVRAEAGDGAPATLAELSGPAGVALDSAGNVYISDYLGCAVRKVDRTNTISTVVGTPSSCGFAGDGGPGTGAKLNGPRQLAVDFSNNLYIADYNNCRIRQLSLTANTIKTFAGSGSCTYGGDGGPPLSAGIAYPTGVAVDSAGDLFISDLNSYRIREVTVSNGQINTVAGTGISGSGCPAGPATSTTLGRSYQGLLVDGTGSTVTFSDLDHDCVRQFTVGGSMATIAGKAAAGFCGDGGPATSACLNAPDGVATDGLGNYFVDDQTNNRVREFMIGGNINTVVGNGNITFPTLVSGEPANGVVINSPSDIFVDPSGNAFFGDFNNCMVRERVKSTGQVNIFAGSAAAGAATGTCGFSGIGGPATSAVMGNIEGVVQDSGGNTYIADYSNCVVWQVTAATGNISLFAGVSPRSCGYNGDNITATSARLNNPYGLAIDKQNNLYIADGGNNRIRKISGGIITTVAGNGTAGFVGDGGPALDAEFNVPVGVAVDNASNIFVADFYNCVVREVSGPTGTISTVAGVPKTCNFNGDGIATQHDLYRPSRVLLSSYGDLFVTDQSNNRVRWIDNQGIMTTVAGNGTAGFSGDGGPALSAELNTPVGITEDNAGNYLVSDSSNLRIRQISAFAALDAAPDNLSFGVVPIGTTSAAQVVTLSALGPLTFSSITVTGPFSEFDDCGNALTNGAFCEIYVFFQPTVAGSKTGSIVIEDNGLFNASTTISLEGIGSGIVVTGGPLLFGNQAVRTTSAAKTVSVTNKSAAAVTFGNITVSDADFVIAAKTCPAAGGTLAAGAKCTISVVFKPKTTGPKRGALVINDSDPSTPQLVGLSGTGTSLVTLTPGALNFPPQPVGTTSSLSRLTLTNNTASSITLGNPAIAVTGPFSVGTGATFCTNGLVLAAGGTCYIYVQFTPTAAGYPTGTLSVTDSDPTSPQTATLSGTATGLLFNPTSVSLSGPVGRQVSAAVSFTNVGAIPVTLTSRGISGPNAPDFSTNLANPPCGGSLAPGAFCNFTVYFTPSLAGSESATLSIYSNSPGSPQTLPLNGTGQ